MSDKLSICVVDAFAEAPYRGNPAGVVFDADDLSDTQMLNIARELGCSETAFISRANDLHRPAMIRWFSPQQEVDFCGHATIAAAHALLDSGRLAGMLARPDPTITLESPRATLNLQPEVLDQSRNQTVWWLDMPEPGLRPDNTNPVKTCKLLGMTDDALDPAIPPMRTRDNDVIYVIRDWNTLMQLQPRFDDLAAWCLRNEIRGICVSTTATLSNVVNVHSRFFAPAVGVPEDPVTGSVHGPLAALMVINEQVGKSGNRAGLMCAQGIPGGRGGLVRALVESTPQGYRVRVAGLCFVTLRGELSVPTEQAPE